MKKSAEKKPMGRPTKYTQELADRICSELAQGKSLRTVCKGKDMPSTVTVFSWFRTHPDFLSQYARAKEESADAMAEEILDISDDGVATVKGSAEKKSGAVAQMVRLQVDTRKWIMSKMKPKKYGDKVDVTSGGERIQTNAIVLQDFGKKDAADSQ
ncbi:MAG: hypothetical protein KGL39_37870 [Patescibacteria group bacterium]|nr:hypothetical protein [Patescibacteria group bacterium]